MRKISELLLEKASREKHLQEEKNKKEYAEAFSNLLNEFNVSQISELSEDAEQEFYEKLKIKLKPIKKEEKEKKKDDVNEKVDSKKLHDLAISFIDFYGGEIPETREIEKKAIDFLDRLGITDKRDQIEIWDYARMISENP